MQRTSTKPDCKILGRMGHERSWPQKPGRITSIALRKRIVTHPPSVTPLHPAQPRLVHKKATWRWWSEKPLVLQEITNTPGPALKPALHWHKSRALHLNFKTQQCGYRLIPLSLDKNKSLTPANIWLFSAMEMSTISIPAPVCSDVHMTTLFQCDNTTCFECEHYLLLCTTCYNVSVLHFVQDATLTRQWHEGASPAVDEERK